MARLHLTVEGQTEQRFARRVLSPYLANEKVYLQRIELAAHAKKKGQVHRGGLSRYLPFRNDVVRRLQEDKSDDVFLSTMIDLYALPGDFPGRAECKMEQDPYCRVEKLEQALTADIGDPRFIPYIQLHEFEAVLLTDADKFAMYYARFEHQIEQLKVLAAGAPSPELIDDGEQTAPSKRIAALIPPYSVEKPTAGPIIAAAIGLATIREKCPHFDAWLGKLETLDQNPS
jgi:Domain of unknown function (DUF4276)